MYPNLPTISLVTCSFQQVRFLDATMRSVIEQAYPALEYVVIDGGSQDGSVEIIEQYKDCLNYWVSERDEGQTEALRKGFAHCTGDILGWLCSDDLLLPGALLTIGKYFRDHPQVQAVYGDSIWIDAEGSPIRAKRETQFNRFVFLHDHNFIPQPSMFWRRGLYEAVGGLDDSFDLAMDSDLWDRFCDHTTIAHMQRYLSCIRSYPEQKTRSLRPTGQREDVRIRVRHGGLAGLEPIWPLLRLAARAIRLQSKARAGGFWASVPAELIPWFEAHATPRFRPSTSTACTD